MTLEHLDKIALAANADDIAGLLNCAFGASENVNSAFQVLNMLRDTLPMQRCLSILNRDEASRTLIKNRVLVPPHDPRQLSQLPIGTLGRTFYEVMTTMKYDFNFYPKPEYFNNLELDADYVNYRALATHDIHHIVTGFALNGAGETGVISVSVQQYGLPGFALLDIAGLLRSWLTSPKSHRDIVHSPDRYKTPQYKFDMIGKGMDIGSKAKLLFPIDWSSLLDQELDCVRAELGIEAVKDGICSWYGDPTILSATGL